MLSYECLLFSCEYDMPQAKCCFSIAALRHTTSVILSLLPCSFPVHLGKNGASKGVLDLIIFGPSNLGISGFSAECFTWIVGPMPQIHSGIPHGPMFLVPRARTSIEALEDLGNLIDLPNPWRQNPCGSRWFNVAENQHVWICFSSRILIWAE